MTKLSQLIGGAGGGGGRDLPLLVPAQHNPSGYYSLWARGTAHTNGFADLLHMTPFVLEGGKSYTFTGFAFSSNATSNVRFAIFASDANGEPDAAGRLFESGAIPTAAGMVTGSMSLTISPAVNSVYWFACVGDDAQAIQLWGGDYIGQPLERVGLTANGILATNSFGAAVAGFQKSFTYGEIDGAAVGSLTGYAGGVTPRFFLRWSH